MSRTFLITGCSGGGKSALLAALAENGQRTVPEPGRRILAEERAEGGRALPWVDPEAFARRALEMARADLAKAALGSGPVFFDRGVIDAAVALEHLAGVPLSQTLPISPYHDPVFLAPPWPELFKTDADRRHGLKEAEDEYNRIKVALGCLGHTVRHLPKTSVAARVNFVLATLG